MAYSRRLRRAQNPEEIAASYLWAGSEFGQLVRKAGFGKAKVVYTFNTAGLEILREARTRGLRTVMEQTIAPQESELALMAREQKQHPDWEPNLTAGPSALALAKREHEEWAAADLILCGSEFVREQIAACGGPVERCAVVPYGVDRQFSAIERTPRDRRLRVLTVGAIGLRKGSPYVLEAARQLHGRAEWRMVGALSVSEEAERALREELTLTGVVPRSEVARHFAWADVFLLPSICEGSATVTYEALAAGLPVIATPNTGSLVRDGIDGFIVPCGNSKAIAEKIALLIDSPDSLQTLSSKAWARARDCTLDAYGERLLAVLGPILAGD